ncbi:ParB N-terminal domain-containing protein [Novosphingobium profundi]|uniref:DUF6551 family protein n=1 Tax=Novosphingobium profundi TaxID=1774954 RepID=UPI001BD99183|nr:DUF6551 family protein [Novosphingobium profundi]MBT0667048.1 ParB N-terminal domain-containing protein [Novosphingobium profundi]
MSTPKPSKLKMHPPLGRMPVLQFLPPSELSVDSAYQRSATGGDSQALIRRIAQNWDWDLCQPLVVARRLNDDGESFFVIDGQHRLEAAKLRGDIPQLPCNIRSYASVSAEAANFVKLNQQRKPLSKLDLFKAAVASGDEEACAILDAITGAGLCLAPHGNPTAWKPGMISNIPGIEASWRKHGKHRTTTALRILASAFSGQVLQLAGTIFPGIAAVSFDEHVRNRIFAHDRLEKFVTMLAIRSQDDWRKEITALRVENTGLTLSAASETVVRNAWARSSGSPAARPAPSPPPSKAQPRPQPGPVNVSGKRWCDQCDRNVDHREGAACSDKFCTLKGAW